MRLRLDLGGISIGTELGGLSRDVEGIRIKLVCVMLMESWILGTQLLGQSRWSSLFETPFLLDLAEGKGNKERIRCKGVER